MKNCANMENSLPLYADGLLSDAEKMAVEKHLAECAHCSKAIIDLKKATLMTQGLQEVEPPPWFKQKIMSAVRHEAGKKSFAQKWFYPLRIGIPVQVMATIVIAVLAVYIYRAGDEQMKEFPPQAPRPVAEAQHAPAQGEMLKPEKAAPSTPADGKSTGNRTADKDQASEASSGAKVLKMENEGKKPAGARDESPAAKGDTAAEKEEVKSAELKASVEAPQKFASRQETLKERRAEDYSLSVPAKKSRVFKGAAPDLPAPAAAFVAKQANPVISVYAADINIAAVEAEKMLTGCGAGKVSKTLTDVKASLQAEIPAKSLNSLLSQLRRLGRVEEKNMPAGRADQGVNLVIEIKND